MSLPLQPSKKAFIITILALLLSVSLAEISPSASPNFEKYNTTYHDALEHSNNNRASEAEKASSDFFNLYDSNDDTYSLDHSLKGKALILSAGIDLNNSAPHLGCPKVFEGKARVHLTESANSSVMGDAYFLIGKCQLLYGNYSQAEDAFKTSQKIRTELFGENDTQVLEARDGLARVYMKRGSLGAALKECQDVLRIRHHEYKKFTPETLKSYLVMGDLYDLLGYFEGGLKLKSNAWDVIEYYGLTDTMLALNTLETLAISWLHWGHPSRAVYQINSVYNMKKDRLAADNLNLMDTLFLYGRILHEKGDNDKAREKLEKALNFRIGYWGPEHPDVGEAYHYIGLSYLNQSNWEKAAESLEKTIPIFEKYFNNEAPKVFKVYDSYGYALAKAGLKEKGKAFLDKAYQLATSYYPDCNYVVGNIAAHQADVLRDEHDNAGAIRKAEEAAECYAASYGEEHDTSLEAEETLAMDHYSSGNLDLAIEKLESVAQKRKNQENPNLNKLKSTYLKLSEIFEKKFDFVRAIHYKTLSE